MRTGDPCFHPRVRVDTVFEQITGGFSSAEHTGAGECLGERLGFVIKHAFFMPLDDSLVKLSWAAEHRLQERKITLFESNESFLPQIIHRDSPQGIEGKYYNYRDR